MSHQIDFDHEFKYRNLGQGLAFPAVNVTLVGPKGEDDLIAIIDSGATYSLFDGVRAFSIGLALMDGRRETLSALSGQFVVWIHEVDLEILGTRFRCEVAFSEQHIPRELLGRHTVFDRVRIGFREGISTSTFIPSPKTSEPPMLPLKVH